MSGRSLRDEIDTLEAVLRSLATIAERSDDGRRKDLIELRRQLSAQIALVGTVAEPVFADRDPETFRTFRTKFSAMRSATALHQANWPAVRLDDDPAAHSASARVARQANRDFIAWARAALNG